MPHDVVDVALVGGGIVSATLASLLIRAEPTWEIKVYERLDSVAAEATNGWHNSGTGHAALCELNYTPETNSGQIDITKAIEVHQQFLTSCDYWASLVTEGALSKPETFINSIPHLSFVQTKSDVQFLKARHLAMGKHHFFKDIAYSDNPNTIKRWAPLLIQGRSRITAEKQIAESELAATYAPEGTDVDFGSLTRQLFADFQVRGGGIEFHTEITNLIQNTNKTWHLTTRDLSTGRQSTVTARTVLIGAGGWTLKLLRQAKAPEVRGYGLLPISGRFLHTDDAEIVSQHQVKVYGKAPLGAPPMSVPHLDARVIDGRRSVMFGPFAGVLPRFLKHGSNWDFILSLRLDNVAPLATMGLANLDLLGILLRDISASHVNKMAALREFAPAMHDADWHNLVAGQRAQIVKPVSRTHGKLQFGTEVITSAEGTLAGVLGASPGASTAVAIALDLLKQCYPTRLPAWSSGILKDYLPSIVLDLANDAEATTQLKTKIQKTLNLSPN